MAVDKKRPSRLGRGLSSLMNQPVSVQVETAASDVSRETSDALSGHIQANAQDDLSGSDLKVLPISQITPNQFQPRQTFDDTSLESLAKSIQEQGLMQPVVVRPAGDAYTLIAGERRWRAAQIAGMTSIPALIKNADDREAAELALVENVQREDLNPIDRAEAFQKLAEEFDATHEQIGQRVGVDRSTITNLIRLLKLTPACRQLVRDGHLSMGQARALAGVQDAQLQNALGDKAVRENLSVRKVEALAKAAGLEALLIKGAGKGNGVKSANLLDLEKQITEQLGTAVEIKPGKKKNSGSLTIQYGNSDQFEAICERLAIRISSE